MMFQRFFFQIFVTNVICNNAWLNPELEDAADGVLSDLLTAVTGLQNKTASADMLLHTFK